MSDGPLESGCGCFLMALALLVVVIALRACFGS